MKRSALIRSQAGPAGSGLTGEGGFIMLAVLGALIFTTMLITAMFLALSGDVHQSQHSLDSKRAYASAQAGMNAYLYQLNQNPNWWLTCGNDTQGTVASPITIPSSSPAQAYSWAPILANGQASCTAGNAIQALIDNSTGSLRMVFTGYAGTNTAGGNYSVNRAIVASFRKRSPLDFLWYTVYESFDSTVTGYTDCAVWYRVPGGRPSHCNINWTSGDVMDGPLYTQDQYLINGTAQFGRTGETDETESLAPGTNQNDVCAGSACGSAVFNGPRVWSAPLVPIPSDNGGLLTDATTYGLVFTGTTSIVLGVPDSTHATVTNCPSTCSAAQIVDLTAKPIIYVVNGASCTVPGYAPQGATYSTSGCAGDVYVHGTYTAPVTIAAANNIIINGPITTTEDASNHPTGGATLGLVANGFVRVMHGCNESSNTDVPAQTFVNMRIDAAILALKHSFIVDNFDCGNQLQKLYVSGALVQNFRGAVGTSGSGGTGYLKGYEYDSRLAFLLPPYLFDIVTGGWKVTRQTLCVQGGSVAATHC
jgi:hypothetical protein